MIVASLDHIATQVASTPNMQKALDFLRQARGADLPDGRMEIDGDRMYALVQSYETVPETDPIALEVHRKYIDVQYMVAGEELIGWASTGHLVEREAYDEAREAWFGASPAGETTFVHVSAGQVAVFYPTDAHAPRLAAGAPAAARKIVVKVAVER